MQLLRPQDIWIFQKTQITPPYWYGVGDAGEGLAGLYGLDSASVARFWNGATWKHRVLTPLGWFKTKSDPK
jgi:hypothetical protein